MGSLRLRCPPTKSRYWPCSAVSGLARLAGGPGWAPMNKEDESGTSACASNAATSTEPEAGSGGAERSADGPSSFQDFPSTSRAPSLGRIWHWQGANRGSAEQFGRFTTMYSPPPPSGGPQAQQAVVTGSGGAKQAGRDDPWSNALNSTWSREIRLGAAQSRSTWRPWRRHLVELPAFSEEHCAARLKCSYLERAASFLR